MHVRINNKVYKVYQKGTEYYIRRFQYNPQRIEHNAEFFELPKRVKAHIPALKKCDTKLRNQITELERLLHEERRRNQELNVGGIDSTDKLEQTARRTEREHQAVKT